MLQFPTESEILKEEVKKFDSLFQTAEGFYNKKLSSKTGSDASKQVDFMINDCAITYDRSIINCIGVEFLYITNDNKNKTAKDGSGIRLIIGREYNTKVPRCFIFEKDNTEIFGLYSDSFNIR